MDKKDLKPESVFRFFSEINQIPRPSKHEEQMIAYLRHFGEQHGLETIVDNIGNVLIRKPATSGREAVPVVTIQSHMDMVCDKLVDYQIDFLHDPIKTYIDGEWLRAEGTTLGADDGIGCAMQLAILDATDLEHGPIECLFTRDEETGLTGANNLEAGMLQGEMLINLDSEDEGLFYVSCAGGKTTTATFKYNKVSAPEGYFFVRATIKGLTGGHSGDDINKKRANAAKLLSRFLYLQQEKRDIRVASINSGKLHNAIPRDGEIIFAVPFADKEDVRVDWNVFCSDAEEEFQVTEQSMEFLMESTDSQPVLPAELSHRIVTALQAVHHGVFSVVQDLSLGNLTETSSNLAVIRTEDTQLVINTSQRSSVMSNLTNMVNTVTAVFQLAGADSIIHNDGYPAWKMNPHSRIRETARQCYERLYGTEPTIIGIHAGLECGLFAERYPHLDMLSIGPTMRGVHSPDERLHIPSVGKVYNLVLEILKTL
ncbi:MAG: aminoacyl-histidine dipeptidase [Prevotella sp.]|nr:aminoacyl-histidine dipeptidase [Prevotella sp.]